MTPLHPLLSATTPSSWTLILCASASTATLVRREVARRGGCIGLTIHTPLGLATERAARRAPADPRPLTGKLWDRCADRAGLQRALSEHVDRAVRVGLTATGDSGLDEILATGPTPSTGTADELALLHDAEARGRAALGNPRYHRVVAVGFGDRAANLPGAAGCDALHDRLLAALGAERIAAPVVREGDVTVEVTVAGDVSAEARWIAAQVARHGGSREEILILVGNNADAERIRAALTRSDIASADDGPRRLRDHALAALLFRIVPWFSAATDPSIHGDDLRILLQSRMVVQSWPKADAEKLLSEVQALDPSAEVGNELRTSAGTIPKVLRRAHLVRAPASAWIAALALVERKADEPGWARRHARLIRARLESLVATRGPTLGHLRAFVATFGRRPWSDGRPDAVGIAILGALDAAAEQPATSEALADALAGGVAAAEIHFGPVLLPYDQYDGRGSELLLLTGLNAAGLGRTAGPDPFFTEPTLCTLGLRDPTATLAHREQLVQAAVLRSHRAEGVSSERAPDTRASAAYRTLLTPLPGDIAPTVRLVYSKSTPQVVSFGLHLDACPEHADLTALRRIDAAPTATTPNVDGRAARLAVQASLEWIREGVALEGFTLAPNDAPQQLRTVLEHEKILRPAIPLWALPWMGSTPGISSARLDPERNLAATSAFEPLTHCRYQAFANVQLGLREVETLVEELAANEVGTAAHGALEDVGGDPRWRVADADRATTIQSLSTILDAGTASRFSAIPAGTAALEVARKQLGKRWERHWKVYVDRRVERLDADAKATEAAIDSIDTWEEFDACIADAETRIAWTTKERAAPLGKCLAVSLPSLLADADALTMAKGLSGTVWNNVRAWFAAPEVTPLVAALIQRFAAEKARHLPEFGPILAGHPEWKFGNKSPEAPLRRVRFGDQEVVVNGAVDLVRATGTEEAWDAWVIDFKSWTGKRTAKEVHEAIAEGRYLQVPLYAIVLAQAWREGWGPPAGSGQPKTIRVVYDAIRNAAEGWNSGLADLDALGKLIGDSVARARAGDWLALPHPKSCPKLAERGHDHCRYSDVCRVRAISGSAAATEAEEGSS